MFLALFSEGLAEGSDTTIVTVQLLLQSLHPMYVGVKVHNCAERKYSLVSLYNNIGYILSHLPDSEISRTTLNCRPCCRGSS